LSAEPVRWGLLSTARINGALIGGVRGARNAELVAVASRSAEAATAYAGTWEIPRAHGTYEALLADPDVEVVYVSLPNSLHVPWAIRALEAGKHVLCEKPLSSRAADAEAAFAAAERAGRLLVEAFMWRHHPQTAAVVRLVREGAVGELRTVRAVFSFALPEGPNVRWDPALEGGALMDVGCYCLNALRLVCGTEPERVSCEIADRDGVDAHASAVLRFPGDVTGLLECAFDAAPRSFLEVAGSAGRLFVEDPWKAPGPGLTLMRADGAREAVDVEVADPYALEVEDLSRAVRTGSAPLLGRDDAIGQARALEALLRSGRDGSVVTLPTE
jgi:D-xylose 1-dehydrogenase (NADP+, D-xylono-1,5-lactone-forming)